MSTEIVGQPSLFLKDVDPVFKIKPGSKKVEIQSAEWDGRARVRVKDEQGKKWQIGFVQVLHKNEMVAVYKKTKYAEVLTAGASLPILDGPEEVDHRPFYDGPPEMKEVQMLANAAPGAETIVETEMYDAPVSDYDLFHNGDPTDPLEEFVMFLTFSTYVAARNITAGSAAQMNLRLLFQWDVVLDRRYRFDLTDPAKPKTKADNMNYRQPLILKPVNILRPTDSLLRGQVANEVFKDEVKTLYRCSRQRGGQGARGQIWRRKGSIRYGVAGFSRWKLRFVERVKHFQRPRLRERSAALRQLKADSLRFRSVALQSLDLGIQRRPKINKNLRRRRVTIFDIFALSRDTIHGGDVVVWGMKTIQLVLLIAAGVFAARRKRLRGADDENWQDKYQKR